LAIRPTTGATRPTAARRLQRGGTIVSRNCSWNMRDYRALACCSAALPVYARASRLRGVRRRSQFRAVTPHLALCHAYLSSAAARHIGTTAARSGEREPARVVRWRFSTQTTSCTSRARRRAHG
jgi:hypothetical protein